MDTQNESSAHQPHSIKPNRILAGSFAWMALGLVISFISSLAVVFVPGLARIVLGSDIGFIGFLIAELLVVVYLRRRIARMPASQARLVFVLYSILSGLTFSVIFFSFDSISILSIFLGTAVAYAIFAIYGYYTSKDLTSIGRMAGFALIGLVVALLFNLFIHARTYDLIVSWIGVIVFTIFTAYDVQKIKNLSGSITSKEQASRAKIIGGLKLYLDFVNLFLSLLRIFGKRR